MGTLATKQSKSHLTAVAGKGIPTAMNGAWNPGKTSSAMVKAFILGLKQDGRFVPSARQYR